MDFFQFRETLLAEGKYDKTNEIHKLARKAVAGMGSAMRAEFHDDGSVSVHTRDDGYMESSRLVNVVFETIPGMEYNVGASKLKKYKKKHKGMTISVQQADATGSRHTVHITN